MTRQQLEHIIRAAAAITKQDKLVIIGSQAILGEYPNAPEELLISMEADVYAPDAPERSDDIDGALGPDTLFDRTHGYHADGVSADTASLPAGWNERLVPICNANTNGATGWCIETHDMAVAKYAAGRPKDLRYTRDLWENGLLDPRTLNERLCNTQLKPTDKPREWIESTIRRQQALHDTDRYRRRTTGGLQRKTARRGRKKDDTAEHNPRHRGSRRKTTPGPKSKHRRRPGPKQPSGTSSAAPTAPAWRRWSTGSPASDSMDRQRPSQTDATGSSRSTSG